jgi:hypothetical protein
MPQSPKFPWEVNYFGLSMIFPDFFKKNNFILFHGMTGRNALLAVLGEWLLCIASRTWLSLYRAT